MYWCLCMHIILSDVQRDLWVGSPHPKTYVWYSPSHIACCAE